MPRVDRFVYELAPDAGVFSRHFQLVQAYVRRQPGSHSALMEAARSDPEGMTTSIVALGAVLLDIAAGAFDLTPEQMLDKLAAGVADLAEESAALPAL